MVLTFQIVVYRLTTASPYAFPCPHLTQMEKIKSTLRVFSDTDKSLFCFQLRKIFKRTYINIQIYMILFLCPGGYGSTFPFGLSFVQPQKAHRPHNVIATQQWYWGQRVRLWLIIPCYFIFLLFLILYMLLDFF